MSGEAVARDGLLDSDHLSILSVKRSIRFLTPRIDVYNLARKSVKSTELLYEFTSSDLRWRKFCEFAETLKQTREKFQAGPLRTLVNKSLFKRQPFIGASKVEKYAKLTDTGITGYHFILSVLDRGNNFNSKLPEMGIQPRLRYQKRRA